MQRITPHTATAVKLRSGATHTTRHTRPTTTLLRAAQPAPGSKHDPPPHTLPLPSSARDPKGIGSLSVWFCGSDPGARQRPTFSLSAFQAARATLSRTSLCIPACTHTYTHTHSLSLSPSLSLFSLSLHTYAFLCRLGAGEGADKGGGTGGSDAVVAQAELGEGGVAGQRRGEVFGSAAPDAVARQVQGRQRGAPVGRREEAGHDAGRVGAQAVGGQAEARQRAAAPGNVGAEAVDLPRFEVAAALEDDVGDEVLGVCVSVCDVCDVCV